MSDRTLWAIHVPGTDEIFAMASKEAAHAAVIAHNKTVAEMGLPERFGVSSDQVSACIIQWPNSSERHAHSLRTGEADIVDTSNGVGIPDGLYRAVLNRIARYGIQKSTTTCMPPDLPWELFDQLPTNPPDPPWQPIDQLPDSDNLFWFLRWGSVSGYTVDGPRPPQPGGYDTDEWRWFAPCESPAIRGGTAER